MAEKFSANDLLSFEKLIAPSIIKLVYFIGLGLIAISVVLTVISGLAMMTYSPALGLGYIFGALILAALGTLLWRITMELYMAFFGLYDRMGEVRDRLPPK